MDNFLETLKQVEAFTAENAVSVFCPVAQLTLDFKPLTVTQTKDIIKSKIDTDPDVVKTGTELANIYNQIIVDNCVDGIEVADKLTTIDREIILFELRYASNPVYEVEGKEVDLSAIKQNIKTVKITKKAVSSEKRLKFKAGDITLKLSIPTIKKDKNFNNALAKLCKEKKINDVLAEVLVTEASKYIDTITLNESTIDFNDPNNASNSLNIIQKLPSSVLTKVSEYITEVKTYRNTVFSVENQLVDLGSDFFSSI